MFRLPGQAAAAIGCTLLLAASSSAGQDAPSPSDPSSDLPLLAIRTAAPPVIDGRLIDEIWTQIPPATGFTQRDPDEGAPASEPTEVRFLYDDDALYIGARLFDADPGSISRRMSARDRWPDADNLSIYIDSMHDHLTGAVFRVSASNVQQDAILFNDTWTDESWDAV